MMRVLTLAAAVFVGPPPVAGQPPEQHDLVSPLGDEVDRRNVPGPFNAGSVELLGLPRVAEDELELAFPEGLHRRPPRVSDRSTARSYSDVNASAIGL